MDVVGEICFFIFIVFGYGKFILWMGEDFVLLRCYFCLLDRSGRVVLNSCVLIVGICGIVVVVLLNIGLVSLLGLGRLICVVVDNCFCWLFGMLWNVNMKWIMF